MRRHHTRRGEDSSPDLILDLPLALSGVPARRFVLVGTYPPTPCGIASYTANLRRALLEAAGSSYEAHVLRVLQEDDEDAEGKGVVSSVTPDDPRSVAAAAELLHRYDLVLLQHEFGIFGADSGRSVLELLGERPPALLTTLHTVMENPTREQAAIIDGLLDRSERVVVHSQVARDLLNEVFAADPAKVRVIPHGAAAGAPVSSRPSSPDPVVLTWGLIGPGKGLEWMVRALVRLEPEHPGIRYLVAGRTHPKVAARQGESYRRRLLDEARRLGVERRLVMIDRYLGEGELRRLIGEASVVVLPYDNGVQTSSGVLTEAVSAGVPVVATRFPHAIELGERGAVSLVPHRDPEALAGAVHRLIVEEAARLAMVAAQMDLAEAASWEHVAARYLQVIGEVSQRAAPAAS